MMEIYFWRWLFQAGVRESKMNNENLNSKRKNLKKKNWANLVEEENNGK